MLMVRWVVPAIIVVAAGVVAETTPPNPCAREFTTSNILLIISAITASVMTYLTFQRQGKTVAVVEKVAAINETQSTQLDGVGRQLDGQHTALLDKVAALERQIASSSSRRADHDRAAGAQQEADDSRARVVAADKAAAATTKAEEEPE